MLCCASGRASHELICGADSPKGDWRTAAQAPGSTPFGRSILSRRGDGKRGLYDLLRRNHEPKIRQRKHQKRAISMYRSLRDAGIVQEAGAMDASGRAVTLGFDLSDRFDLTQPSLLGSPNRRTHEFSRRVQA